uniref:Uncharacterized protein n=1 Tax=Glossina palpalis gambiensis TaxID=67801 RepID=A0A1B0BHF4_9MUSC
MRWNSTKLCEEEQYLVMSTVALKRELQQHQADIKFNGIWLTTNDKKSSGMQHMLTARQYTIKTKQCTYLAILFLFTSVSPAPVNTLKRFVYGSRFMKMNVELWPL